LELSWKVSANNGSTLMPNSRCYIQPLGRITPLLSQEGWREAPGWFHSETLWIAVVEPPLVERIPFPLLREAPGWFHSETYRHSCFGYFRFSSDLIFG